MEKEDITRPPSPPKDGITPKNLLSALHSSYPEGTKESEFSSSTAPNASDDEEAPRPAPADGDDGQPSHQLERWNQNKTNIFRYFGVIYAFILLGMSDAALGVSQLLQYIEFTDSC